MKQEESVSDVAGRRDGIVDDRMRRRQFCLDR